MHFRPLALAIVMTLSFYLPATRHAHAETPKVVSSILPLHALVSGVMEGVGQPHLLLPGGASPHDYSLRPSDARQLADARVVFWIGETLEVFLARPLAALAGNARVVEVLDLKGITLHPMREGGIWEPHDDEEKKHEKHGKTGSEHAHDHAGPDGHVHAGADGHVCLDPDNAKIIVAAAARTLAEIDPGNAARYKANAAAMTTRLDALDSRLRKLLQPVATAPYIVFHDAYQYFERQYGLNAAGAITVSPGRSPGARRLIEIRTRIKTAGATCVFIEPQFEPRIARTVVEGTGAQIAVLDPLGAALTPGKDAYFTLMDGLATSLTRCLSRN